MIISKAKKYDDYAREKGAQYAKILKGLRYFRFDSSKCWFVETEELPHYLDPSFIGERHRRDKEIEFIELMRPFIAYITAPTAEDGAFVIDSQYEEARIAYDNLRKFVRRQTNGLGFDPGTSKDEMLYDLKMHEEVFKIIAGEIEKVLGKIEKMNFEMFNFN